MVGWKKNLIYHLKLSVTQSTDMLRCRVKDPESMHAHVNRK